jgi:hypothetical protein
LATAAQRYCWILFIPGPFVFYAYGLELELRREPFASCLFLEGYASGQTEVSLHLLKTLLLVVHVSTPPPTAPVATVL